MVVETKGSRLPTTVATRVGSGGDASDLKEDIRSAPGLLLEGVESDIRGVLVMNLLSGLSCGISCDGSLNFVPGPSCEVLLGHL